jgi:hypothetical protein
MKAGVGPVATAEPVPLNVNVPLAGGESVAVTVMPDGVTPVAVEPTIVHVDGYSLPAGNADATLDPNNNKNVRLIVSPSSPRFRTTAIGSPRELVDDVTGSTPAARWPYENRRAPPTAKDCSPSVRTAALRSSMPVSSVVLY